MVLNMALALDSEAERLNEGCEEADGDADGNRDAGVARLDRHEREMIIGKSVACAL